MTSRYPGSRGLLSATLFVALMLAPAYASAAVTGQTVNVTVTPDTQSASTFSPASLQLSSDTTFSGTPNVSTKEAVIHFDNDIAFDPTGLATCNPSLIQGATTAGAIAACPGAEVGSGQLTAVANATLPFVLTAFNAAPSGGNPQLLIHARDDAINLTIVLPGILQPSSRGGDFGSELDIVNWPNTGIGTTHFDLTFPNPEPATGNAFVLARCADSDQTWNFAADLSFYDNTTQQATSTQACHASTDADGDGIVDAVDTQPTTPSDAFNDSAGTSGTITDRGGLPVTIKDAAAPSKGVHVSVGAGTGEATIQACGSTQLYAAGTEADLTCGSTILDVTQGEVEVVSPLTVISVPAGASAEISDNGNGTYTIQNLGGGDVTVTTNGVASTVPSGGSATALAVYAFSGFFKPVDNPTVLNLAKAGQAIPVKFSLGGNQGLNVLASGYPKSQTIVCGSNPQVDGIETTVSAASSGLSYDPSGDQYTYVWKTDKAWANTCRQLVVKLADGTSHVANFSFK